MCEKGPESETEDVEDVSAADARFAKLLDAGTARREGGARDPTVGDYGPWTPIPVPKAPPPPPLAAAAAALPVQNAAAAAPPPPPPLPPLFAGDAVPNQEQLGDLLASWYYAGYYTGRFTAQQEAAVAAQAATKH